MSNKVTEWARSMPLKRSSDKFLLFILADRASNDGENAFPSYASLMNDSALDRKTVVSGMKRLCAIGLIVDTGKRAGDTKQIVVYRLAIDFKPSDLPMWAKPTPKESKNPQSALPVEPSETDPNFPDAQPSGLDETDPNFPSKSPVFPEKASQISRETDPKTGHGTILNHHGTIMEPSDSARARNGRDESLFPDEMPSTRRTGKPRRKLEAAIDPNWEPDEAGRAYAASMGIANIVGELRKFINHAVAKDRRQRDWPAAWRGWCDNFPTFNRSPVNGASAPHQMNRSGLTGGLERLVQKMPKDHDHDE